MGGEANGPVEVPVNVYTELDELRDLGTYDMSREVLDGLAEQDLDAAFEWVVKNPRRYAQGLRDGMKPK